MHEALHFPNPSRKFNKIYFIEFLRIFLIFSVFLLHLRDIDEIDFVHFHNTKSFLLVFAVEYFFIIGGFLLYKSIIHSHDFSVSRFIGKRWIRLAPCVIFGYVILLLVGQQYWGNFPFAFSLVIRVGFGPTSVAGGPDWFVGPYFITCCFLIALFKDSKGTIPWICLILTTLTLWLVQVRIVPDSAGHYEFYCLMLNRHLVRAVTCMGIGMVASCLSEQMVMGGGGIIIRVLATLIEATTLFMCICFMYYRQIVHYNLVAAEISFAMLLISASCNLGYISALFNKCRCVRHVSRYVYSFLIMHGTVITLFRRYRNFGYDARTSTYLYIVSVILLTLIEYHLIEKRVVPSIRQKLENFDTTSRESHGRRV